MACFCCSNGFMVDCGGHGVPRLSPQLAKLGTMECQLTHLLQERQAAEKQTQSLRSQLSKAQEKVGSPYAS